MAFVPISIRAYARKHVEANPGENLGEAIGRLEEALRSHLAGKRCACGEPIWVIGSAGVGHACFTCITGEAWPDRDYEIAEALKPARR